MDSIKIVIGKCRIADTKMVNISYETAAWNRVIAAEPGEYAVCGYCRWSDGRPSLGHSIYVNFHGPVVGGDVRSRLFGAYGRNEVVLGVMMDASESHRLYWPIREGGAETDIPLSDVILPDGIELDPERVFVERTFVSNGQRFATIQIRKEAYAAAWAAKNTSKTDR